MLYGLRRIAVGVLGTSLIAVMAVATTPAAADAAATSPHHAAAAAHRPMMRWPVVRKGDFGIRVRTIQYLLDAHGAGLTPDGDFGLPTYLAVQRFQRSVGLFPDGIVGNATWPRLIITVRGGDRGFAVAAAQDQLRNGYGFFFVAVDGDFGPITGHAVRHFQFRFHLVPDGIVGPATWNTMVWFDHH